MIALQQVALQLIGDLPLQAIVLKLAGCISELELITEMLWCNPGFYNLQYHRFHKLLQLMQPISCEAA